MSNSASTNDDVKQCLNGFVCPLNEVRPGTVCRVRQVLASPEVSRRIREMGFCEDQRVKCLSQQCMMICQVCNARLGLSEQLAKAILVEPEPGLREAS
ncbi:MAG: FeoA family protein [Limisphaerales bacterium]